VLWNGPLGIFEQDEFSLGTIFTARYIASKTMCGELLSVAGGGDTTAAIAKARVATQLSYVSTAGGAFLEWLEGKTLPGIAALGGC
jgi:phosphoglycerate kinase